MEDLVGKVFSSLTVKRFLGYTGKNPTWLCECTCGVLKKVSGKRITLMLRILHNNKKLAQ